ncbi:CBS domain-containing protein [Nitrosomonas mobilis]|uniref:CBS domain-containing protein n=1 Tax=Nitrosomonas mobilis TaxID=51642 RepID=A0A1G5SDG7_9PROT|nr:CBS domain-containing protein [Nitrosomonas mobilis]SCZ84890.1 conserved hypothetical protein [Nitrosomonas mobilis]
MTSNYHPLPAQNLTGTVRIFQAPAPEHVVLESPALDVMTNFRQVNAAITAPNVAMELANAYMMQHGVRSLFVVNQDHTLIGLITASDILGEKPLRFIQERRVKHNEILVSDIMTPLNNLEAIAIEEVARAKVGDVVSSLRESGRQHALVIEKGVNDIPPTICGIFSLTQIEKQLGTTIIPTEVAKTFAEIEARLAAS